MKGFEDLSDADLRERIGEAHREAERWKAHLRELLGEADRRGMPQREIAEAMGVSQPAVSQRIKQIRQKRPRAVIPPQPEGPATDRPTHTGVCST